MPLLARTRGGADIAVGGQGNLLGRCLAAGLPLASACSGRGACARCLVTVLVGGDRLQPPQARESRVLARNQAAPDQRLACQCEALTSSVDILITTGYW